MRPPNPRHSLAIALAALFLLSACAGADAETRERQAALESECGEVRDTCRDKCREAAAGDKAGEQTCTTRCLKKYRHCKDK